MNPADDIFSDVISISEDRQSWWGVVPLRTRIRWTDLVHVVGKPVAKTTTMSQNKHPNFWQVSRAQRVRGRLAGHRHQKLGSILGILQHSWWWRTPKYRIGRKLLWMAWRMELENGWKRWWWMRWRWMGPGAEESRSTDKQTRDAVAEAPRYLDCYTN